MNVADVMKRRTVLAALGALVAGCTSSCEHAVEPAGFVEPAGDIACVEQPGDGVVVTMAGVDEMDYVKTTILPMRDPGLTPLELARDQLEDFPVLRNGLAYFSYDYDEITVKSRYDQLRHQNWLRSYWKDRRGTGVVPNKRPFRLDDGVFSVYWIAY